MHLVKGQRTLATKAHLLPRQYLSIGVLELTFFTLISLFGKGIPNQLGCPEHQQQGDEAIADECCLAPPSMVNSFSSGNSGRMQSKNCS